MQARQRSPMRPSIRRSEPCGIASTATGIRNRTNMKVMTMPHYNRRRFIKMTGAGIAAAATTSTWRRASAGSQDPDLVVINANIHTVDDRLPKANSFAVKNGRFIAVGNGREIGSLKGKASQVIDAQGMTIVPGFIDCHNHAVGDQLLYDVVVGNPFEVEFVTIDSILEKLKAKARQTPPGYWVEGYFYDDTKVKD